MPLVNPPAAHEQAGAELVAVDFDGLRDGHGAIVCAQGGTAIVDGLATTLADAQIPVSAFWIQA